MRDYGRHFDVDGDNSDDDDLEVESRPTRRRSAFDVLEPLLLVGALALIATPAIKGIARRYRVHHPHAACDDEVDQALKDTYPASDPPAQRYVDIPVNRR